MSNYITPERQVLFDKYKESSGKERVLRAREFVKSNLSFLIRQLDDDSITPDSIAIALRDIAALISSPSADIIFAGKMPPTHG